MKRKILVFALLLSLVSTIIPTSMFLTASGASPYTEVFGTLNGANYVIRIPNPIENWNKNLVVFCHGYSHLEANVTTLLTLSSSGQDTGIDQIIAKGYAVAASTYGAGGICIQQGINSTYQLTKYIINNYNVTGKVLLYGVSMGGNIALLTGQKYPQLFNGVLDLSGTKDSIDSYNTKMDFLAATNDSEMITKLQAINASLPPYPFSVLVPPPLSQQLFYWRAFLTQTVSDLIVECGGTPQNASQSYIRDSPTGNANISIPVITIHGTSDALVPYTQSLKYQAAVAAAGRSDLYRLYLVPGGQHVPDPLIISQLIPRLLELNAWANTLGDTNTGSYQDGNDANAKSASYFMSSYSGPVTDIFAYVATAGDAGVCEAAIYADNGGSPGALIAATDKVTVGSAFSWVDFHLALPVNVTSGTGYWLSVSSDNGLNMMIVVGSGVRAHNGISSWFSDPFGPVWGTDDTGAMSIYAKSTTIAPPALGNTNIGSYQDGNDANAKSVSYFMCSKTETVTDIFAYVARVGATGDAAAAIYADNGGSPGALIATTNRATVSIAYSWVDFQLPSPVAVTSGTGYWLAISSDSALNLNIVAGSGVRVHNGLSSWFSNPFGPVWGTNDAGAMSIYAT